jgi:hypothetical protein
MFELSVDDRLSAWASFRQKIETSNDPFLEAWEFWKQAPYIPYNHRIDPFNPRDWPTPWEIIVHNKYDDFTKSLMIAYSLRLTTRFKEAKIQIKTIVNHQRTCYYNIVCVDDTQVINYNDNGPVSIENIPESFYLENLVDVKGTW